MDSCSLCWLRDNSLGFLVNRSKIFMILFEMHKEIYDILLGEGIMYPTA